jgi:hypothetical protein
MCKLCNTDRQIPTNVIAEVQFVAYEYLGEYMCQFCRSAVSKSISTGKTPDEAIMLRLYKTYYQSLLSKKEKTKYKCSKYRAASIKETTKFGIIITTNLNTKRTTYSPRITTTVTAGRRKNKTISLSPQATLIDALLVKLNYLQENGHTRSIAQITKQLKELQNENKTN